ncbi:helix-turn-helix domain-containing protein [Halomonas sp. MCCC 1A17488]|uniref:Helix-turn-helix domain-containing protein n=1 Tax=Billgrantia sulfidoxydans TaxID=2733484 RepID=A0ABX7W828_9GAMM|nr:MULTISPECIES: RodZ domain-containing protein [Halomonas]MCE8017826.1 helix-turn-helix domain-containing protein [Halomonas sp. MCCC 1A17488]MCG3241159.1 helix-turn-helix domain-containing protein [Halomonas sp. MCCC 1A17488]QPP49013.1 helix-turn-helix domain-containing protein [Halomonas sp. SS10-MC5]QTP56350.1 helix-turn-helix domain-containing protein [Halomonas sulfidoxydans]
MSDNQDIDAVGFTSPASPGELLRRERETQGLSREEVATALNLRPAVVTGMEEDSYEQVPVAAYRRGYLRAYARLLGMDDRPVLQAYADRFGSQENEQRVTPVQVTKPPSRLGAWLFKLVTLLVIAGLIGLTLVWWQSRDGNEPPEVDASGPVSVETLDGTTTIEEEPAPEVEEALPPLPEEGVDPLGDATTAPPSEVDPTGAELVAGMREQAPVVEDEAGVESSVEQPIVAEEAPEPAEVATTADRRELQLTFNEQSWTEIFDANNRRVFVGLQEPGTTATVEGEPPFRLTIGNATGVELSWAGERVDLGARAGANNVARFTLGE